MLETSTSSLPYLLDTMKLIGQALAAVEYSLGSRREEDEQDYTEPEIQSFTIQDLHPTLSADIILALCDLLGDMLQSTSPIQPTLFPSTQAPFVIHRRMPHSRSQAQQPKMPALRNRKSCTHFDRLP